MIDTFKSILDNVPVLQKPTYRAYMAFLTMKYALYRFRYLKLGQVPRRMSDRGQDRWVIDEVFKGKRGGFFVEAGAFDGFSDSNTFVLEKKYGWTGLCVEPNPENFRLLTQVFKREATCVPLAVDAEAGKLEFVMDGQRSGVVGEEGDHSDAREVGGARARGRVTIVEVAPLAEILDRYGAPRVIDYLSLDVEGLETRIMRNFPFDRYIFLSMTIERPSPELNAILFRNGYHFVRNSLYDTFYVHESLPGFDRIVRQPFRQLPPKAF